MIVSLTACSGSNTTVQQAESTQSSENAAEDSSEIEELSEENEYIDGVVQTTAGLVQGTNEDGIYRYLGVPYAEAKERFVPAEDVTPWEGIRMADTYGPMSPQGAISGLGNAGTQEGTDNNSQNLNIWTPGVNDGEKRPVMVWLHGGGFSTGSANEEGYDGEALSRSGDVVVVSVNHRLNVFGYLDLSAYGEKYKDSANVGIRDIVDSLEWIQENIEAFGGDPDNVTVFGQSGGGAKVLALMTSPYAKGLFESDPIEPTEELETALREAYPDKTELTAEQVDTTTIRLPLLKIMSHKADQNGAPVYAYLFTYGNSYHGAEIPYVLNHVNGNEEEQALAEQISQAWINFARTGIPGAEGMPEWEPYTRESGATMILDTEPELVYHHDQELLSILVPDYEY